MADKTRFQLPIPLVPLLVGMHLCAIGWLIPWYSRYFNARDVLHWTPIPSKTLTVLAVTSIGAVLVVLWRKRKWIAGVVLSVSVMALAMIQLVFVLTSERWFSYWANYDLRTGWLLAIAGSMICAFAFAWRIKSRSSSVRFRWTVVLMSFVVLGGGAFAIHDYYDPPSPKKMSARLDSVAAVVLADFLRAEEERGAKQPDHPLPVFVKVFRSDPDPSFLAQHQSSRFSLRPFSEAVSTVEEASGRVMGPRRVILQIHLGTWINPHRVKIGGSWSEGPLAARGYLYTIEYTCGEWTVADRKLSWVS